MALRLGWLCSARTYHFLQRNRWHRSSPSLVAIAGFVRVVLVDALQEQVELLALAEVQCAEEPVACTGAVTLERPYQTDSAGGQPDVAAAPVGRVGLADDQPGCGQPVEHGDEIAVVIPGLDPWDEVIHNPYLWHWAFHAVPELPELLVQGNQTSYFDYFFRVLSVDPARITSEARAGYAHAYASTAALTAAFDFFRAFPQDAQENLASTDTAVDTPVLYVGGEGSRGDIDSYAHGLRAAGIRRLTARLIPDTGHFIADEQPRELWRAIHEFITDSGQTSTRQTEDGP